MFPKTCKICQHSPLTIYIDVARCENCKVYQIPLRVHQKIIIWCYGKNWPLRLGLLIYLIWIFNGARTNELFALNRLANPLNMIDFGIHELGHFIFMPFGTLIMFMGGSIFQILFPLVWFGIALWKRWYFSATLILIWVSVSMYDVATYIGDARARSLPLVGLGSDYDSSHDWYNILLRLDKLENDTLYANTLRTIALGVAIVGIASALILLFVMITHRNIPPRDIA